ncbi:MAG: Type secretion system protein [Paucimonas sp.]|nr:Type secretion system protein [Paucimonas sp.]
MQPDKQLELGRFNVGSLEWAFSRFMFRNIGGGGRRRLWEKLIKMMGNDVQLLSAIDEIRDRRIKSGAKGDPETVALGAWGKSLRNGLRLSSAIEGWASPEEVMLISAGEESGRMALAMQSTIKLMEAKRAILSAVFAGLAYPVVLMLLAFAVTYLFGFKIVPSFTQAVHSDDWTGLARALMVISSFAQHYLWMVAVVVAALVVAFFATLSRFDGPTRVMLDRYPPYSVYRILQGSTWLIAVSALVGAGMRVELALQQLSRHGSSWLANRIEEALAEMRCGLNMGEALNRTGYGFPDPEIIDDLCVYSSLSGFEAALKHMADEWLHESVRRIKAKMSIVFGVSILSVGLYIAFLVTAMMQMQLQMSDMLQKSIR